MTIISKVITFDGSPLSFGELAAIGQTQALVVADQVGLDRCRDARVALEATLAKGALVYGATTGVGAMKDKAFGVNDLLQFNRGLVLAHHFAIGQPLPLHVVRSALAIRVNTALSGKVGCTPELVEAMISLLRSDVIPMVRQIGSIGCADIGLMSQIGAVLTGNGEAYYRGELRLASEALAAAGLEPHIMAPKDALAVVSTNAVGIASAGHVLARAAATVRVLLATATTAAAALGVSHAPWKAATIVGTKFEGALGAWLMAVSENWNWPVTNHIHDPLSLRMLPQIYGATFDRLNDAGLEFLVSTARPDDNPIIFEGQVLASGGSLPLNLTLTVESLATALAHVARNAFNLCVLLVNGGRRGLLANLVAPDAIATGLGPILKLAGDLLTRVLADAGPVSPTPLVVAGGMEDEASFLPFAVERMGRQIAALEGLTAVLGLLAVQASDLSGDLNGGLIGVVRNLVREKVPIMVEDRVLSGDVEALAEHLSSPEVYRKIVEAAPSLPSDEIFLV
jgi:histidine ammonia-lyase